MSRAHAFAVPLSLVYGFIVLSAWWVCRANPLDGRPPAPRRCSRRSWARRCSRAPSGAASARSGRWRSTRLAGPGPDRAGIFAEVLLLFAVGVPLYLLSAIVHYLFLAFEASHAAERRVLETEVSAREAELRALRAQLNPHFLFNSLNSINALVGSDPEGARRMCERLGDFLRRTLALGARDAVTLGEELELVDRYLAIEQVRFGARLAVERRIGPGAAQCVVPPLLLQPLVENAVKHGVADRVDGRHDRDRRRARRRPAPGRGREPARRGRALAARLRARARERARAGSTCYGAREARLEVAARRRDVSRVADAAGRRGRDGGPPWLTRARLRVLVVDDEAPARALLREYLGAHAGRRGGRGVRERLRGGEDHRRD